MKLETTSFEQGAAIPLRYAHPGAGGENVVPELSWTPGPEGTKSYAITCYDPDAPTGSGFWHWIAADIPADVTHIDAGGPLPQGVREFDSDYQEPGYGGPNPPAGPAHRYVFTVSALDVDTLGLDDDASPAMAAFTLAPHCIARATLTATYSVPGEPGAAAFLRDGK